MYTVDVLAGGAAVGRRAAVIGAGGIGFDVCEFIAHKFDLAAVPLPSSLDTESFMRFWGVDTNLSQRGGMLPPPATEGAEGAEAQTRSGGGGEIFMLQRKRTKLGAFAGDGKRLFFVFVDTFLNTMLP